MFGTPMYYWGVVSWKPQSPDLKDAERWLESADTMKVQLRRVLRVIEGWLLQTRNNSNLYRRQLLSAAPISLRHSAIFRIRSGMPARVLELVPEGDHFRHAQASMLLGMTYWASGDLEAAERVFAEYTMKLRTAGNIPDAISTSVVLADIRLALGHLHEAINTLEQLLQFVMDQGEPIPLDAADLHRELSKLHLEQGNLEAAAQHLQRSKELGEKAQSPVSRYRLCIDQARLKTAQGDLEGALALLDEAQRLYIRSPLPDFCPISAMKARIWVAQGKLTKALEWVREQGLSVDDAPQLPARVRARDSGSSAHRPVSEATGRLAPFTRQSVCWSACCKRRKKVDGWAV